jgi:hypothetical protein
MTRAANGKEGKILEFENNLEDLDIILENSDSGSTLTTVQGGKLRPNGKIKILMGSDVWLEKKKTETVRMDY